LVYYHKYLFPIKSKSVAINLLFDLLNLLDFGGKHRQSGKQPSYHTFVGYLKNQLITHYIFYSDRGSFK